MTIRIRGSAARPPGASRCSARASLRTPSRPHPPHDGASPATYIPGFEAMGLKAVPTADSTSRGVAAGRSAQRGTSAATTGGGGRSAPDPELAAGNHFLMWTAAGESLFDLDVVQPHIGCER